MKIACFILLFSMPLQAIDLSVLAAAEPSPPTTRPLPVDPQPPPATRKNHGLAIALLGGGMLAAGIFMIATANDEKGSTIPTRFGGALLSLGGGGLAIWGLTHLD